MLVLLLTTLTISLLPGQVSLREMPLKARQAGLTFALPDIEGTRYDTSEWGAARSYDMLWRDRRGEFEVRAKVEPYSASMNPAVLSGILATNYQDNTGEDFVAVYSGGSEELDRLRADWLYFWDYAPKEEFSTRKRCHQASYYRRDAGLVHLWMCYDDSELIHSNWMYILPFATDRGE